MTAHDGVTSDGRSSHSDRHSVLPPKQPHLEMWRSLRVKKDHVLAACLSAWLIDCPSCCCCPGESRWPDLPGRLVRARRISNGFGQGPRRRATARADEVIKVRQESTRDDAISTAGPRVMASCGRVEGGCRGATMPQIERQRVQYSISSATAHAAAAAADVLTYCT